MLHLSVATLATPSCKPWFGDTTGDISNDKDFYSENVPLNSNEAPCPFLPSVADPSTKQVTKSHKARK